MDYPGKPNKGSYNRETRGSESGRLEDDTLLALKMEKGGQEPRNEGCLKKLDRQGNRFSSAALLTP